MPRRPHVCLLLCAAVALTGLTLPPAAAQQDPGTGLPSGVPDAALRAEPELPAPERWPFGEQFPRTSGTGRTAGGAAFWTDFLYDDHGATSELAFPVNMLASSSALAPTEGVYRYDDDRAAGNGADVFRNAVGLDAQASYWRVDWSTLVDPRVPLAVWGIDLDDDPTTGGGTWPAGTGVSSPGEDAHLVVSAAGARLLVDGQEPRAYPTAVDLPSRSFVVRVPRSDLAVAGRSGLRLVAGLADASGEQMAPPQATTTGEPVTGTHVYNASFRAVEDEPPVYDDGSTTSAQVATGLAQLLSGEVLGQTVGDELGALLRDVGLDGQTRVVTGNYWMEDAQAHALAAGTVEPFSQPVDWTALAGGGSTPEPQPSGYSNRWYVSTLDLGQGVVRDAQPPGDLEPNVLGRVQPYAVQVPEGVGEGAPLTWVLHSLGVNHNQYGALNPQTLAELCDGRGSICATTLGHGPDLWYFDESEADFWQVWRELAETYRTSSEHTVISGYSMGGYAAYKIGLAHADLFAAAMSLAGPPSCGVQLVEGALFPADSRPGSRCAEDGPTTPLIGNALHLPYVIAHGAGDQLVPVTSVLERAQQLRDLGYRHELSLYPAEDHLVYATQDRFSRQVAGLGGTPSRTVDPAVVRHAWYPHLDDAELGIGTTTAHWLSGFRAATDEPGVVASVEARSLALADPAVQPVEVGPEVLTVPSPGVLTGLAWQLGAAEPAAPVLELELAGTSGVTVDAPRAGVGCGTTVRASTDAPAELVVAGLPAGARLDGPGADGATAALSPGETALDVVCAAGRGGGSPSPPAVPPVQGSAGPRLPATGGPAAVALAGVVLLLAAGALRRRS